MSDEASERIVQARLRLMERFKDKRAATPSLRDGAPQGQGPQNRHGMPQVPVGQIVTQKWPVLDLGIKPEVERSGFRLAVDGAVQHQLTFTFDELISLPVVEDVSDFHCVTTWSRLDVPWRGVRVADVLARAEPHDSATHVMAHAADGYTTNIALEEVLKDDVLLAFEADGGPLPPEHGGPLRMITPQLYAWKGAKWINRLEILTQDRPGFWEERGYSMTAHPWRNDRYR